MIPVVPWYLELIVLAANFAIAVAVWRILYSAAEQSGLPPATRRKVRAGAAIFLGVWLGAALLLAPAPASLLTRDRFYLTPLLPLFILAPVTIALLAIRLSPAVQRVIAAASLPALIRAQVYRTVGIVFLILLALGQIPAHFALPAGWGDIAIGLTAPLVALAVAGRVRRGRTLAFSWNVLGLLDLAVAVGMGTGLLAPFLAPHLGNAVPPAAAMGVFPMVLVPTFAVPLSVLLHLLALRKLRREVQPRSELMPKVAS